MPLLPNCDQTLYERWVIANQFEEGFVNGIWNAIFSRFYDTSRLLYSINPEAYEKPGRMDLLVVKNIFPPDITKDIHACWQIIYEGKSGKAHNTWQKLYEQLLGYAENVRHGRFVYLVGGLGRYVAFWKFRMRMNGEKVKNGISLDIQSGKVILVAPEDALCFNIITHQTEIENILNYFIKNPPLDVNA